MSSPSGWRRVSYQHDWYLLSAAYGEERATFIGADFTGVRWPVGEPVPEGWMIDGDSHWLKRKGQLSEVMAHYLW
jgi:hypothetical protein